MGEICGDNRFEIINKAKEALLESTNIEASPEEMAVLDNFLFRCWQMRWLDKYETEYSKDYFTGMKHLADAINYEIGRMSTKNEQLMEKYVYNDYFRGIDRGLKDARKLVNNILYMQLEVKGEENRMKYIIELDEIPNTGLFKARGANTLVFDQRGIENILEPYEEEHEIDWYKVAVDTPILVKDSESEAAWKHRYFAKYVNGVVYTWMMGRTSWSADNDDDIFSWNIAKLAEEGKQYE